MNACVLRGERWKEDAICSLKTRTEKSNQIDRFFFPCRHDILNMCVFVHGPSHVQDYNMKINDSAMSLAFFACVLFPYGFTFGTMETADIHTYMHNTI